MFSTQNQKKNHYKFASLSCKKGSRISMPKLDHEMLRDYFGGNLWRSDCFRIRSGFCQSDAIDPGFVNPVRSRPGFIDPARSGPAFVNVSEANASQFSRAENIRCGNKFCCSETKTVFALSQKHFYFPQTCQLSLFCRESHDFSSFLTVSRQGSQSHGFWEKSFRNEIN